MKRKYNTKKKSKKEIMEEQDKLNQRVEQEEQEKMKNKETARSK